MKTITYDETQWQLMPKKHTKAMVDAFCPRGRSVGEFDFDVAYDAMLAVAPTPKDRSVQQSDDETDAQPDFYVSEQHGEWLIRPGYEGEPDDPAYAWQPAHLSRQADMEDTKSNPWKLAVDHMLVTFESTADSYGSPAEAVAALVDWHVAVATDPKLNLLMPVDVRASHNSRMDGYKDGTDEQFHYMNGYRKACESESQPPAEPNQVEPTLRQCRCCGSNIPESRVTIDDWRREAYRQPDPVS